MSSGLVCAGCGVSRGGVTFVLSAVPETGHEEEFVVFASNEVGDLGGVNRGKS